MSCVPILPSLAVLKIFFVSLLLFPYPEPCITSYNVSCIQEIFKSQFMKLSTRRILFFVANMLLTSSQFLCSIPCQPPLAPEVFVFGYVTAVHHTYRLPRKTCFSCISSFCTHNPSRYCAEGKHSVNVH